MRCRAGRDEPRQDLGGTRGPRPVSVREGSRVARPALLVVMSLGPPKRTRVVQSVQYRGTGGIGAAPGGAADCSDRVAPPAGGTNDDARAQSRSARKVSRAAGLDRPKGEIIWSRASGASGASAG